MQQRTTPERMMGVGTLASLTAGLVAGIGARIIMRIVALTSHMPPQFSIDGTLNILFNGTFLGLIAGFVITMITVVLAASPKVRKYVPGPIWRGLIVGIFLLLVCFPILLNADAAELTLGIPLLDKSMFAALILIYGITFGVAEKAFDHYLPFKPTPTSTDRATPVPTKE